MEDIQSMSSRELLAELIGEDETEHLQRLAHPSDPDWKTPAGPAACVPGSRIVGAHVPIRTD